MDFEKKVLIKYPFIEIRQTWRKDETLRDPIKSVMKTVYNWVKRKISSDGRFPHTENTRNSHDIENMA